MPTLAKLALLIAAAGCGEPGPLVSRPHGYAAHMEAADVHDQRAQLHRQVGSPELVTNPLDYQCGDRDLSDQLTSAGKPMLPQVPCWDPVEEHAERARIAAIGEEKRARDERRAAASLVEAELAACRGISPAEVEHSPFAHHKEIAEVIPHREAGTVRGVRIVFKPVLGLSPEWMEQAIACHRARFERLGEPPTYLSDDPTLVAGATATVSLHNGHLEVLVVTRDDVAASVALGRAEGLIRPRTAVR